MLDYDLTRAEQVRRTDLAQKARRMILSHMKVEAEDETSLTLDHRGYYMQISFSPLHPLLVVCLAKAIRNPDGARKQQLANELNLHSVLGSHAINEDVEHPLRSQIRSYYNSMAASVQSHAEIPSFCARSIGSARSYELKYDGTRYTVTLTDTNGVLSNLAPNGRALNSSSRRMQAFIRARLPWGRTGFYEPSWAIAAAMSFLA